jgi:hypothetical protein
MNFHWPYRLRMRKPMMRETMARETAPPLPWLELDRVRTALSCVILAALLALIIVGGHRAAGFQPDIADRYRALPRAHSDMSPPYP